MNIYALTVNSSHLRQGKWLVHIFTGTPERDELLGIIRADYKDIAPLSDVATITADPGVSHFWMSIYVDNLGNETYYTLHKLTKVYYPALPMDGLSVRYQKVDVALDLPYTPNVSPIDQADELSLYLVKAIDTYFVAIPF